LAARPLETTAEGTRLTFANAAAPRACRISSHLQERASLRRPRPARKRPTVSWSDGYWKLVALPTFDRFFVAFTSKLAGLLRRPTQDAMQESAHMVMMQGHVEGASNEVGDASRGP
jgi:hypothetical protein